MTPEQIQTIVLRNVKQLGIHVLHSTLYSLSNEPGEEDVQVPEYSNCFICGFIATYDEYMKFREACNKEGVWINAKHWPIRGSDKFEYSLMCCKKY